MNKRLMKPRELCGWVLGLGLLTLSQIAIAAIEPKQVCAGRDLVRVLDEHGAIWAWGGSNGNTDGQMGFGDDAELEFLSGRRGSGSAWHFWPQRVRANTVFVELSCSDDRTAAIDKDGALWVWGQVFAPKEAKHQDASRPVRVGAAYRAVSLGHDHALAIQADGSLWAWGANEDGQLGDGSTEFRTQPVKIGDGFVAASAGYNHSLALKADGSLWAWGGNSRGQIGQGEPAQPLPFERMGEQRVLRPVLVPGTYQSIGAGIFHSAAVRSDGAVMVWGQSDHAFGRGVEDDFSPVPVKVLDGFSKVSVSQSHVLALNRDGTVWEWGWRREAPRRLSPDVVGRDFKFIHAGNYESAAIGIDNTLWLWGGSNWLDLARHGYRSIMEERSEPKHWLLPTVMPFPAAPEKPMEKSTKRP